MESKKLMKMSNTKYAPPVLKNFGENYGEIFKSGLLHISPLDEWEDKHTGKFLLSALEDIIRVWALGGAFTHSQVYDKLNVEGIILGGGGISVNDEGKPTAIDSRSLDFGSLPNKVLEDYFSHFGYKVKTDMFAEGETKEIKDSTRKWFKEHGIVI